MGTFTLLKAVPNLYLSTYHGSLTLENRPR